MVFSNIIIRFFLIDVLKTLDKNFCYLTQKILSSRRNDLSIPQIKTDLSKKYNATFRKSD